MPAIEQIESTARNSKIRDSHFNPIPLIARGLLRIYPGLTANQATKVGKLLSHTGSAVSVLPEQLITKKKLSSLTFIISALGFLFDGLDGKVAEIKGSSSDDGALLDHKADKTTALARTFARGINAVRREDQFGLCAAILAGILEPVPALLRTKLEEYGDHPKEFGIGTHAVRGSMSILSTAFPEAKILGVKAQPFFDSVQTAATAVTIFQRSKRLKKIKKGILKVKSDADALPLAKRKKEFLTTFIPLNTAILLALGLAGTVLLQSKKVKNTCNQESRS